MRHTAFFCAVSVSLAFAGCADFNQVAGPIVASGIDAVKANPSLIPCLASEAAVLLNPAFGKGTSIRGTNMRSIRVSRQACAQLGGAVQTSAAVK